MNLNKFTKSHQQLTEADMKAAEKRMGFALPAELRKHYFIYNGGEPERRCWKSDRYDDNYLAGLFPIRGLGASNDEVMDVIGTLDEVTIEMLEQKLIPPSFVPFAYDGGDNYFCIDRDTGKVYFYPMDLDSDFESTKRYLADSFNEFMEGLIKGDNQYL